VQLLQMQTADNTGDRIVNAIPGLVDKIVGMVKKKKDKPTEEGETPNP